MTVISALTKKWQGKSQYRPLIWAVTYISEEGEKTWSTSQ